MELTIDEIRRLNVLVLLSESRDKKKVMAEKIETDPAYISQILTPNVKKRRTLGNDLARKLEVAYNKSRGWMDAYHYLPESDENALHEISGVYEPVAIEANAEPFGSFDLWDSNTPLGDDEVALPFYREVELSAGSGRSHIVENGGRKLRFARSTLRENQIQPHHAACVTVSGNSMEPVMMHGTTVGIDTSITKIVDGEVYAIDHDGQLRVKLLSRIPGGGLKIKSYNNEEYPDEVLGPEEAKHVRVLGWVFWVSTIRKRKF